MVSCESDQPIRQKKKAIESTVRHRTCIYIIYSRRRVDDATRETDNIYTLHASHAVTAEISLSLSLSVGVSVREFVESETERDIRLIDND